MLNLAFEYRDEFQSIAAWLICSAALVWGGGPERAIALTWLVLFKAVDNTVRVVWGTQFMPDGLAMFAAVNDLAALAIFVFVALQANRVYTLWIAALQLLVLLAHVARGLADQISPISYTILAFAPGYFQLCLLAGGLFLHTKRRRRFGGYRDWRPGVGTKGWMLALSKTVHGK